MRALVIAWAPGGNLPPMLAAATLLARREHEVLFLASGETRDAAARLGFPVTGFRRSPDPETRIAFEAQAEATMAMLAGPDLALDARDAIDELQPDLAIVDCMLPAAIAGARAAGTPTASLVHFLYGLARTRMRDAGGGWTTDLRSLAATHRELRLPPVTDGLSAWEAPELVLVTAPRWFDVDAGAPRHVVHAGPLDVATRADRPRADRPRVLLTFSSTVMEGQPALIGRVCEAVAGPDVDVVLTLGPAVDRDAVRVPDGVEVLTVADHDDLMPGCAAVVSHGGLGTVLRALAHGVPLLLLALGRDQAFNAGRVARFGAGIHLPTDAPPHEIRTALEALLFDSRFAASAAELEHRIAVDQPDRTAAAALESVARRPGRPRR
jgi:UDP:flavonoid glycosyltransferase YjiC (YdhE family)